MTRTNQVFMLLMAITLAAASTARAQAQQAPREGNLVVDFSFGGQTDTRTFTTSSNFPLYDETAFVASAQNVGGGFVFDIGARYRVWRRLSARFGISTFNGSGNASIAASIPHPLFPGQPNNVTLTKNDLTQSNVLYHFQGVWTMPLAHKIDLSIFGGPSIVHVRQDIATVTVPAGTQDAIASSMSESGTAAGGSAGVDVTYRWRPRIGLGGFIRYAGGSVDLASVRNLKVGGLQLAAGVRYHF